MRVRIRKIRGSGYERWEVGSEDVTLKTGGRQSEVGGGRCDVGGRKWKLGG